MGRGCHAPFRRAIVIHHWKAWHHHICRESGIPKDLLSNMSLRRDWSSLAEHHAGRSWRRVFFEPINRLRDSVHCRSIVGCTPPRNTRSNRARLVIDPHTPLVNRQSVWRALIPHARHRHPRVGITPAQRGIFFTVIHAPKNALRASQIAHVPAREKCCYVFISGPIYRHP